MPPGAYARRGVGRLTVVDNDTVALSNINRQLIALHSLVGEYKTDAFARRALDINPRAGLPSGGILYCRRI